MKAVNVDEVLKILHRYGKYIFVTDEKKYSDMVDEIANLKALEQEPTRMIDKTNFSYEQYKADLQCAYDCGKSILDKIIAEIDKQEKWLLQAGYNAYNVDIAFSAIKSVLKESEVEE